MKKIISKNIYDFFGLEGKTAIITGAGNGIGKALFNAVKNECPSDKITVNSSPYAVPIYHKLGFTDTDTEQVVNGLRFTPMECKI